MILNQETGGMRLPTHSMAERIPPLSSRGHASGHLMVADGGIWRIILVESDLEFKCALTLDADPNIVEIREQVRFDWPQNQRLRTHYFDFVVQMRSGQRVALIVKPAKRARTEKFLTETRAIAQHVVNTNFAHEVRVFTDECLDSTTWRNAQLFRNVREKDPDADAAAIAAIGDHIGVVALDELVGRINLGSRGFRALVRLTAAGHLVCVDHEEISPSTLVRGGVSND